MRRKIKIKLFNFRPNSLNNEIKMIVVGYNNRVNGAYIERIGFFYKEGSKDIIILDVLRLIYGLQRGVIIKSKVSGIIGMLGYSEKYVNNK